MSREKESDELRAWPRAQAIMVDVPESNPLERIFMAFGEGSGLDIGTLNAATGYMYDEVTPFLDMDLHLKSPDALVYHHAHSVARSLTDFAEAWKSDPVKAAALFAESAYHFGRFEIERKTHESKTKAIRRPLKGIAAAVEDLVKSNPSITADEAWGALSHDDLHLTVDGQEYYIYMDGERLLQQKVGKNYSSKVETIGFEAFRRTYLRSAKKKHGTLLNSFP